MTEGRRIKRYVIDVAMLIDKGTFHERMHPHYMFHGLPENARFVGMSIDPVFPNQLHLYVTSPDFPEIPYNEAVPAEYFVVSQFLCDQMVRGMEGQIHGNFGRSSATSDSGGLSER